EIDRWNRKEGDKHGQVLVVDTLRGADIILARYALQEQPYSETRSRVSSGTVVDEYGQTVTRPVPNTYSVTFVPGFSYIIARKPDGLQILWRMAARAEVGETKNSGRFLRNEFIQMLKDRGRRTSGK